MTLSAELTFRWPWEGIRERIGCFPKETEEQKKLGRDVPLGIEFLRTVDLVSKAFWAPPLILSGAWSVCEEQLFPSWWQKRRQPERELVWEEEKVCFKHSKWTIYVSIVAHPDGNGLQQVMRYLRLEARSLVRNGRHWFGESSTRSWGLQWNGLLVARMVRKMSRGDSRLVDASARGVPYLWPSSTSDLSPDHSISASKPSKITSESPASFVQLPMPGSHPQTFWLYLV